MPWLVAWMGCQEPFDVDRHDLVGFRVAALEVPGAELGTFVPRAAVIVDGRPWADPPATLRWGWAVDEDDAADGVFEEVAEGAAPILDAPRGSRTLVLVASRGADERRAFLTVPETPVPPVGWRFEVGMVPLPARPRGPELALDRRAALEVEPGRSVDPRGWLRVAIRGSEADHVTRFMATAGTFLETSAHATDWTAADGLVLDEDEVDDLGTPVAEGAVTVVALDTGEPGVTSWRATEVFVGDPPAGVWLGERFVPTVDVPDVPSGDAVRVVVRADPTSPCGVALHDGRVASAADGWGTDTLACDPPVSGPFDPDWFLTQRCAPSAVDGAVVVVAPSEAP